MIRMLRLVRLDRRTWADRRRIDDRHPAGAPRVLVVVCSVLLASLAALVPMGPVAEADTTTGPSTRGTASTVSPSTVAVGGTIMYTISGFPSGATVQVLIDDGTPGGSQSLENEVVTTVTVKEDGTASGSFELPDYVEQGNHWLRFRVSGAQGGNAADYTNKSPYFTGSGVTVIGGAAPPTVPAAPTPPPHQVAATGGSKGASASGIQAAGPGAEPAGFPIIGASILALSMILVVLSVLVAVNRRRMAAYQRRRAVV